MNGIRLGDEEGVHITRAETNTVPHDVACARPIGKQLMRMVRAAIV